MKSLEIIQITRGSYGLVCNKYIDFTVKINNYESHKKREIFSNKRDINKQQYLPPESGIVDIYALTVFTSSVFRFEYRGSRAHVSRPERRGVAIKWPKNCRS